ncbi:amino acid ABC transporter permease [Pandoraea terrae]|uniref:Amino acid ABC transporter permease n=1 Tax=Pandoraea terrae TaxID=1537710 RepID=A0A5E4WY07_9BURK|nr:amino acid ABC transporter permease [Pandoraea terrae]VVE29253.1 amino acid ABC transporter permease [Pandoraea terrae]
MNYRLDFDAILHGEYGAMLIRGLKLTLFLTVEAWILAVIVGTALAVLRLGGGRVIEKCVQAYVAYHQSVPMLVQILLWYFGISSILPEPAQSWMNAHNCEFLFSVIAIGLCMAAYISEDLRSGLRAVPYGQQEASRSLGLSYLKTLRHVVLPQAVRVATPALINHSVLLFKNTSLAMAIGCAELSYATREIENHTFRTFESYLIATVVYLLISLLIMATGAVTAGKYRIKGR